MNTIFLGLHTGNLGTVVREFENPFTGESVPMYEDIGMTASESDASAKFLAEAGAPDADPEGFRKVLFASGGYLNVNHMKVGTEIEVCGSMTPEIAEFIFGLALASGMVVRSSIEPDAVAVLPGQHHSGIDVRWPHAVMVSSVADLLEWIESEVSRGRIAASE